jgi:hypothetical protein
VNEGFVDPAMAAIACIKPRQVRSDEGQTTAHCEFFSKRWESQVSPLLSARLFAALAGQPAASLINSVLAEKYWLACIVRRIQRCLL